MADLATRLVDLALDQSILSTPPAVVHEAKRRVLDSIGCMIGGRGGDSSQMALRYVRERRARPEATVVGEHQRTSPELAAFANGALIRYLDFHDSSSAGVDSAHPSGAIAGLLAVAEARGAGGPDLIQAILSAYDAMVRVQRAVRGPGMIAQGFHNATLLGIGVPVGAARLLNLDRKAVVHALRLSLTYSPTLDQLRHGQIPNSKGITDAWVVSTGVRATLLAEMGMEGPEGVIEGAWGFAPAVAGEIDEAALLAAPNGHQMLETGLKAYPCVGSAQSAVAAVLALHAQGVRAEAVSSLEIGLPLRLYESLAGDPGKFAPATKEAADHSLPYCAAVALLKGELGPGLFSEEWLQSPAPRALMTRITLRHDEDLDRLPTGAGPARVTIHTVDGGVHEARVLDSPGRPGNPLPDAVLSEKFRMLCRGTAPEGRAEQVERAVRRLDQMRDVRRLTALLRW